MLLYSGLRFAKFWTAATVALCGLTLLSNTVYLQVTAKPRFLLEKGALMDEPWWLAAFYFHVLGASVCLIVGTPLMFSRWTARNLAWHRRLGYVYVNAVLWMAAPSGLGLAFFAKGGSLSTIGFALAGLAWWLTTWSGYHAIRQGNGGGHVRAMARSYAWALSAPAFRTIQTVLHWLGLSDGPNYVVSLWLSIAVSVWLAESFIYRSQHWAFVSKRGLRPAGVLS